MRKLVLLAVLAMVLVAVPAFASVQNIKVSGDIDSTLLIRDVPFAALLQYVPEVRGNSLGIRGINHGTQRSHRSDH